MSTRRLSAHRCHYSGILGLTIGVCKSSQEGRPNRWILMLADRDGEYAIGYRVLGGPSQNLPWEVVVEDGRLNSFAANYHLPVAEISAGHVRKVKAAARKNPGRFCQEWVVDVLRDLEVQGVVPPGTVRRISNFVEEDPYAGASPTIRDEEYDGFHDKIFEWLEKRPFHRLRSLGRLKHLGALVAASA
ncbi:hypothetical protein FBEOM_5202 [Fusarium beomiforme]|uniref:Uncharacterized protein n=1 Tax=Fusarium beomiforme TaxID=44412 RepID=A0A9P5ALL1_9HYPO|nr:hypothetical protein FBEOM_5202 [Fusarium beomiforme]